MTSAFRVAAPVYELSQLRTLHVIKQGTSVVGTAYHALLIGLVFPDAHATLVRTRRATLQTVHVVVRAAKERVSNG